MSTTSVRPANLESYVTGSGSVERHLVDRVQSLTAKYRSFQASSGIVVSNPDLIDRALPDLLGRIAETRTWVEILRDAVLQADQGGGDGTVTIGDVALNEAMVRVAQARGIDLDALGAPDLPTEVAPPTVGPIPQDSGYVNDPVCTATGHFLEDEIDLAMPDRLRHLRWARRYSSRQLDEGGHGRGWWTWASARCTADEELVTVVCPEGRHVTFPVPVGGAATTTDGADVTLQRRGAGWALAWGGRSLDGPETWLFGQGGAIEGVDSPVRGDVRFQHLDGRLVAMRHEGGRSVAIDWEGDRIAAVRSSDGREVRYRYNSLGDLVEVERALGGRRYEPDADGRIVRVVDADGVVLCVNRFDQLGRVVRQVAATGRVSVFRYDPGRITNLFDTTGRLLARYEHDLRGRVERFVAPSGARLERRFDKDGCVVEQHAADGTWFVAEGASGPDGELRITHGDSRVEVFRYDELGRVAEHQTATDEPVRLSYDGASPLPTLVEGALGWRQAFGWGPSGERRSFTDADGVTVTWASDIEGMPSGCVDSAGNEVRVQRHFTGVVERFDLPDGAVVRIDVDEAGRPVRIVDATNVAATFGYTPAGRLAVAEHPATGRMTFTYGDNGFLEQVRNACGAAITYERDEFGRPVSVRDATGATWRFSHSDLGVLVELTSPGGATWRNDLDALHRLERAHDPQGRTTEVGYDDAGRLHRAAGPLAQLDVVFERGELPAVLEHRPGGRVELEWDQRDRPVVVRDADGVAARYEWTPANRLAAVSSATATVERRFDETGALVALRDGGGGEWRYEHDWLGRVQVATSPEGRTTRLERDLAGRTTAYEHGGTTTRYVYDERGRLTETLLPTGAEARVDYDAAGRPKEIEHAGGARSRLHYDQAGRFLREVDPAGGEIVLERDLDGNIVARRDQLGRTTRFHRDRAGVLTSLERGDGTPVAWDFDPSGRVAAVRSGDDVLVRYGYGADGLLSSVEEPGRDRLRRLAHTAAGRLTSWDDDGVASLTFDRADGLVVRRTGTGLADASWTYGPNRVEGMLDGRRVSIVADLDGSTRELRVGDGSLQLRRDANGRIVAATGTPGGELVVQRDDLGRVIAASGPAGTTRSGYDEVGHLAWHEGPDGRQEWRYDQLGRLVEERREGKLLRYEYDAAHQLLSVTADDGEATTFEYDGCGRRTAEHGPGGTRRYQWDALGRLAAVIVGGERIDVDIDAFGLLCGVGASRVVWDHSGAQPVPAAVDGQPLVTIGHRVVAEGDRLVLGGLLGPAAGPSPWGWASDAPVVQVDCGLPGGLGFAGLVWLGARIYDPVTRQFLSPDPLPGVLGTSVASNPYHYADNDPLNRCDPTGLNGQPMSIDDFNQMRDDATGFQWDNLLKAGIALVGAVLVGALAATGAGLLIMVVAGATVGATTAGLNGLIDGKTPSQIRQDMIVGAVFGAVGGAAARGAVLAAPFLSTSLAITADAAAGGIISTGQEAADSYLPGGDGQMDWEKPIIDTVVSTAGSQLGATAVNRITPDIDLGGIDLGGIDLGPSPAGGTGLSGAGATPLAPPAGVPSIALPNAGAPRLPGSSLIDANPDLVRTPGGILLPPGVSVS